MLQNYYPIIIGLGLLYAIPFMFSTSIGGPFDFIFNYIDIGWYVFGLVIDMIIMGFVTWRDISDVKKI